ncbi:MULTISPECIES: hypothetical protein [unclassified Haematospirillum]|uniref:hypothetical protein n=1 Tax=unclassified Haematospirillum TaxID=2622088 RepID=UPI00143974FA|nr:MULTISPECIES: hypothetical protein [unclassified Haematospirillum]NKD55464.1 hypothetical protein [Haematospirillum sp. H4890]NKD75604.1 hypothetical protein [Haematospirillum sp. H4485]
MMDGGCNVDTRCVATGVPTKKQGTWEYRLSILFYWSMVAFVVLTFRRHGISNDELVQHTYGDMLWRYYASGLTDTSLFSYRNLYLYGGAFDLPVVALLKLVPSASIWDLRHLLSGLVGVVGLVGTGRLATYLYGPRMGLLAIVLLALCGIWSGAMFTHTKDIPFATAMIWGVYTLTRIVSCLPRVPLSLGLGFGLSTGLALGLRVGGGLLVCYAALVILVCGVSYSGLWKGRALFWFRSACSLFPGMCLAFVLMAFFWPWSVQQFDHIPLAIKAFSNFSFEIDTILSGIVYQVDDVPRTYLPIYLLVKMSEPVLLGLFCGILVLAVRRRALIRARQSILWVPVVAAAVCPVLLALITNPPLYNGVRHFLFVVPPLVILSAAGLYTVCIRVAAVSSVAARRFFFAVFGAVCLLSAVPLVLIHPYGYVGYNILAGGLSGAVGRWEMDYWSSSVKDALVGLQQYALPRDTGGEYRVAVCAELVQADAVLGPGFRVVADWLQADFFVSATQMGCDAAMDGDVVVEVRRLGVPLAVVKDLRPVQDRPAGYPVIVR